MTKDYLIEVKIKNGPMKRAMRATGYETTADLSRATGISQRRLGKYLNLKLPPLKQNGNIRDDVLEIAAVLKVMPLDLFPEQHLAEPLRKSRAEAEVSFSEIQALLTGPVETPEDHMHELETVETVASVLQTLPPRMERVLRKRFGIGCEPKGLDAIGAEMGVTRERIRQIEQKALHRLKHRDVLKEC